MFLMKGSSGSLRTLILFADLNVRYLSRSRWNFATLGLEFVRGMGVIADIAILLLQEEECDTWAHIVRP